MSESPEGSRTTIIAVVVVLVVVAVVAVLVVARSRSDEGEPVAIVGDSITELSMPTLRRTLSGDWKPWIVGRSGYTVGGLQPDVENLVTKEPVQAVINLGTNDVIQKVPLDESMAAYTTLLDSFDGVECIHAVTVNEAMVAEGDDQIDDRAKAFNRRLRGLARERDLDVIEWAAVVRQQANAGEPEGALLIDTVHPTQVGQRILADYYANALLSC
jgi:hypothetical protein